MIQRKPTISIYFDKRRQKQNGTYPVKLRLTASWLKQKNMYFHLLDLTAEEWEQVDGKGRSREVLMAREEIQKQLADAHRVVDAMEVYTHGAFKDRFVRGVVQERFVSDFFQRKIKNLEEKEKHSTAAGYRAALAAIKDFRPRHIYFQDVTVLFLTNFVQYLQDRRKSQATIKRYVTYLKSIYGMAIKERIVSNEDSPFDRVEVREGTGKKKGLKNDVIAKLLQYSSSDRNQQFARDMWVLSFCIGGANMPDIAYLTPKNVIGDALHYDRIKTGKAKKQSEPVVIALNSYAKDVLNRYDAGQCIFPIIDPDADSERRHAQNKDAVKRVNKYLRRVCTELEIDRITFGSARHSFATRLSRMGVKSEIIASKMGHAKGSEMTEHYVKTEAEDVREIFEQLTDV